MEQLTEKVGEELERDYVKSTYDNIAEEFSGTRYKKWPKVDAFLRALPTGSLLLDVGCGNGKYLDNPNTINIGCDLSLNLLTICRRKGFQVVNCDMMRLPFRTEVFDSVICIAALHHIVTSSRRQKCLEGMLDLMLDRPSKLLVQVWSFEQELNSDNPYLKRNKPIKSQEDREEESRREVTLNETKLKVPVHKNRTPFVDQDLLVPFKIKRSDPKSSAVDEYLRYYHVFKEKELDSMIEQIPNCKAIESYYDRGNWCSVIEKDSKTNILVANKTADDESSPPTPVPCNKEPS